MISFKGDGSLTPEASVWLHKEELKILNNGEDDVFQARQIEQLYQTYGIDMGTRKRINPLVDYYADKDENNYRTESYSGGGFIDGIKDMVVGVIVLIVIAVIFRFM